MKSVPVAKYKGFIVDLDGVIYLLNEPIPGSVDTLKHIQMKSMPLVFLTNNSSSTVEQYVEKIGGLGIDITPEQVVTSSQAVRRYLEVCHHEDGWKAFVIGMAGLMEELEKTGLEFLSIGEAKDADYVLVGWDRHFNYDKLKAAVVAIRRGAKFVACNLDATYPTPEGLWPGAGAIVAAIVTGSETEPYVAGKPNPLIVRLALERLGLAPGQALLVGDRLDTDIEAGLSAGVDTLLVLTGISKLEDVERTGIRPTYTLGSFGSLLDEFGVG